MTGDTVVTGNILLTIVLQSGIMCLIKQAKFSKENGAKL
jgi:hypothetical protein